MPWPFLKRIIGLIVLICLLGSLLWVPRFDASDVSVGFVFVPSKIVDAGLDPSKVFQSLITDLKPEYIRIPVEWNLVESQQGEYNFDTLVDLLNIARRNQVRVILSVGHRLSSPNQCNEPLWMQSFSDEDKKVAFRNLIVVTSARLKSYQSVVAWEAQADNSLSNCALISGDTSDEIGSVISARDTRSIIVNGMSRDKKWIDISVARSWKPPVFVHNRLKREGYFGAGRFVVSSLAKTTSADGLVSEVSYARAIGSNLIFIGDASDWYIASQSGDTSWIRVVKHIIELM